MNQKHNYKELFKLARELRDCLKVKGNAKEVKELNALLDGYWSTTSEVLGDFMITFKNIRYNVNSLSEEYKKRLDNTIGQIEIAFDRANNPE